MAVIDLGDLNEPTAAREEPARVPRRLVRRLGVAVVAVLSALTLTVSGPAPGPQVRTVWSVPQQEQNPWWLSGDALFVHRMADGNAELAAYDLATGALRWTRPTGGHFGWQVAMPGLPFLVLVDGIRTVEVTTPEGGTLATDVVTGSVVLDTATGEARWRAAGGVAASTHDDVLITEPGPAGEVLRLRLVDARDGRTIWTLPAGPAPSVTVGTDRGGQPAYVALRTAGDRVRILRYADGAVLADRRLPWPPARTVARTPPSDAGADLIGDLYLVSRRFENHSYVVAYRVDGLTEAWRVERDNLSFVHDCGPVVCLGTDTWEEALDPATGAPRWAYSNSVALVPGTAGGLLSASVGDDRDAGRVLLNAASGSPLGSSAHSALLPLDPGGRQALLLRDTAASPQRTAVLRADLATGATTALGSLPSVADIRCEAAGRFLVCQRGDRLEVVSVAGAR